MIYPFKRRPIFPALARHLTRLHGEEGGAVLMLMLAGTLICLMLALTLYDVGLAATDKMNTQTAADTAAFSSSVVKARSMNMISVANTNKRMIYGIETTYNAAMLAIVESEIAYAARCFRILPPPDPYACARLVPGTPQAILAIVEFFTIHLPMQRSVSRTEVELLDHYQKYLIGIAPWWAWVEGALRGAVNDGTFATTWPPPGDISEIFDKVTQAAQGADFLFGSSISSLIPEHSDAIDGLPLARRDDNMNKFFAATSSCLGYTTSVDHGLLFAEYMMRTSGIGTDGQTIGLYAASLIPACYLTWFNVKDNFFDYQIAGNSLFSGFGSSATTDDDWLQATSVTAFGYRARGGRNTSDRERLDYMEQDYDSISSLLMRNEGQFAMARSEIVYQPTGLLSESLGGLRFPGGISLAGFVNKPEMWNPAWTAKLRPVTLPNEIHGATVKLGGSGDPIGLSEMAVDMVPYVIVASIIGLLDRNMKVGSTIEDFFFFVRASGSYDTDNMEGIAK